MVSYDEQLRQNARELALQHTPVQSRLASRPLWKAFYDDMDQLESFVRLLNESPPGCAQSAEEWLLDNAEFLEEQAIGIKERLTDASLRELPVLRNKDGRALRIEAACRAYLDSVDNMFDENTFVTYMNAYQEVSVLTLAEVWALPLIMRMTMIGRLSDLMEAVRERKEACLSVEQFLQHIEPSKLDSEQLTAALDEAGQHHPLSGPWVVHLISHLREWADDAASVREWLLYKLEKGSEDLNRIMSYEHKLQAGFQLKAGRLIGGMRELERLDWEMMFGRISLVEKTLQEDASGDYPLLDAPSRDQLRKRVGIIAARLRVPEPQIARQIVLLARKARDLALADQAVAADSSRKLLPRNTFLAYYLHEADGLHQLRQTLRTYSEPDRGQGFRPSKYPVRTYFSMLGLFFGLALFTMALWMGSAAAPLSIAGAAAIVGALIFPASEWAVVWLHYAIGCTIRPKPLLRYNFSAGIPEEAATMVVIPVIWSSREGIDETVSRLELHYLANRDPHIQFAILGDYTDAPEAVMPGDEQLLQYATEQIQRLNRRYPREDKPAFHFFIRERKWNEAENVFMGWERKRGKLAEFAELLQGRGAGTSFTVTTASAEELAAIRYVITLDADTQLPIGSAGRMIGTMHLPYNRPRLNKSGTRVVEGYGMLQPRIAISYEGARQSRLTRLWSGDPGIDPYAFAVSDPYQDAFGHGIFTGKGIFDVEIFAHLLHERIPENRVLSHDLLEGGFMRTGLLADIELIDDHPAKFNTYQQRQHRWIRGDWQLICWLAPRVCDRNGVPRPVDLPLVTRWQMVDNLRRSLMPLVYFVLLALGLTVLPGNPGSWFALIGLTMLLPIIRQLADLPRAGWQGRHLLSGLSHVVVAAWMLPFQSALLVNAVSKTVYRLAISKRHLLEWVSSADVERRNRRAGQPVLNGMPGGYTFIALFAIAVLAQPAIGWRIAGWALCLIWAFAPLCAKWLDQPIPERKNVLRPEHQTKMLELAHQIWSFYADYAGPRDHYLPPDNVQLDPPNGVAHRTSPTNIGFLLTAILSARDFCFIRTHEMIDRLEKTIGTIERMEKWNGHLYNWYDTVTLAPLPPRYVSTVDSGNFVASLIAVKQGVLEWLKHDRPEYGGGMQPASAAGLAEFAVELSPEASSDADLLSAYWMKRAELLIERLEALIAATDFQALYDGRSHLFTLGFHGDSGTRETILYDLLASEARQTSFVAIALGQIPVSHWFRLGRSIIKQGPYKTLVSWSGTMFEYMMPWLLMRTYEETIWDSTYRGIVKRQIEYGREHGVPYGISESGYYAFDHQMNYQYRAFGVPGLGFKRGLEEDLVLSPYAAIMSLPYAVEEGMSALEQMEELGARGQYGFYEAIDFTAARMPAEHKYKTIRSYMAHHQGMSLLTLANLLLPKKMYDRFHADKRVEAAELLLKERIPARSASVIKRLVQRPHVRSAVHEPTAPLRDFSSAKTLLPEVAVYGNDSFSSVVTNSGGGFNMMDGIAVTRWREDPVMDQWGSFLYIRDLDADRLWSPSYQPCKSAPDEQHIEFTLEKAQFTRKDGDIRTKLEISVPADFRAEIRRLTLTNGGSKERLLEVTTYVEVVLTSPVADESHQAFSKLFIETEYVREQETLLARRRPRESSDRPMWAVHALSVDGRAVGPAEFETSRSRFIGRGNTMAEPQGIGSRLQGITGAVADPALIMRRRISVAPGASVQLYMITGAAYSRDDALAMARGLSQSYQIERAFQSSWTRNKIEQRHLNISSADAVLFQRLAGRVLYAAPLSREQQVSLRKNKQGQPGLWAHGISGERPIIQVRIADATGMPFVTQLLQGHQYLRRMGIAFDLVVLIASNDSYQQELHDALQRTREQISSQHDHYAGTVVLLPLDRLSVEERDLFTAVSKAILRADGPSLKAQLRVAFPERILAEPAAMPARMPLESGQQVKLDEKSLLFFNGWGGFKPSGKEYAIAVEAKRYLPAPWINVMANPVFGTFVSELGTGYTWWRNSRECKLTPWSNDTALDKPGEVCYLRDESSGAYWPFAMARGGEFPAYQVVHGRGYSRFSQAFNDLQQQLTMYVPLHDPVKLMRLELTNYGSAARTVSFTYYAEWVLGVRREGNAAFLVTEWTGEQILMARNGFQDTFREATAFLAFGASEELGEVSYSSDRGEFIGRGGAIERPDAMGRANLSNQAGTQSDGCGAIRTTVELAPGASRTVYILLGCAASPDEAGRLVNRYRTYDACESAFKELQQFWTAALEQVQVATPSREMDLMLNNWLLYQTLACRMWARTAFYQAGGAYGFRDQLQDSLAMLHSKPDITRAQILLHASHQYVEGDVQHWWHEETARGIRTRFSDDLLWLPYAVSRYVEHTGDHSILDELAPYLTSETLQDGEQERYEATVQSGHSGPVYEHCIRVIERSLTYGEHGLPLFGCGDWNDGMSRVGIEGRGESVWLGWFLSDILQRFASICEQRGELERAERYRAERAKVAEAINVHGWDGQWYRRAFHDSGEWLGSAAGAECRIDAIAQSWSALSGAGEPDKVRTAMQSFDRELVDRSLGVVALLTPPFDQSDPSPGYIQGYPPGLRENGGQYTHGVLWSIAAWSELEEGDKAFELFHMLNPITHTRTAGEVQRYAGEPYVMSADVYTTDPLKGHAGWTWYTGASGWMYQVGLESILGVTRRADQLFIRPCIPRSWPEYSVNYRFGNAQFHITVYNPQGKMTGVSKMTINGIEADLAEYRQEQGVAIKLDETVWSKRIEITM
ncbi:GH36-type glycosyl hydrolase domain-containing protein [Paenibacillus sp. GCM10027626]|uniref:GH36-type glycosyl hydrolase domain-containing protein n=1 Tax=Paenibacillus sp. GCM10027626 TaxID=3273411 RepID=UPI003640BF42